MDEARASSEELASTPVTELSIGNAQFRRRVKNAGFVNILELFALEDPAIESLFSLDDADSILDLKESYERDRERFARQALPEKVAKPAQPEVAPAAELSPVAPAGEPRENTSTVCKSSPAPTRRAAILPLKPFSSQLRAFEARAEEYFSGLTEYCENAMVYQAFEEFSTELDEIREAFEQLFEHFSTSPRQALNVIERSLPNIFTVYVADQARSCFDGSNLWGNFFGKIGIEDGNVQGDFKEIFVSQLAKWNMPLYARGEKATHYLYSALLHGGLSAEAWEELWRKALLPLAEEIAKGNYRFSGALDGRAILQEMKGPDSRFAPKKSVLSILEKAPDSTIAPLFEASMKVALQVKDAEKTESHYRMLTSYGLPDVAVQALWAHKEGGSTKGKAHGSGRRADGAVYVALPMASLQLDLDLGKVCLRWSKKQFPADFSSCRIDYYVDGGLALSKRFEAGVGRCILDEAEIQVAPQARYDVELKLMKLDEETGEWAEQSALNQAFTRNKPGCFEFVRTSSGTYRLRGASERIARKSRIAYIVKDGYRVVPGPGMEPVAAHDAEGEWSSTQIFLFDVEPGASGSVVNGATGEEVAVWQERYSAKINKQRIIGETASGLDLYGYANSRIDTNAGLPSITIEAADGMDALDDLEITCFCDGKRVSVPREVMWRDEDSSSKAAQIALIPAKSALFDWHIENCVIEARQSSAGGRVVFRYRFSVVPIQEFRPETIEFDHGVAVATYRFTSRLETLVTDCQGESTVVHGGCRYYAKTLLKDEFLHVRIQSVESGKVTDAMLGLAAMEVELPRELMNISAERPVCLADARELGPSAGNVRVRAYGWRYNRAALVMLGGAALFYRELKSPGEHSFNLFGDLAHFKQVAGSGIKSKDLVLLLCYGDDVADGRRVPAWTDSELLPCREGLGYTSWSLRTAPDKSRAVSFDEPLLCDTRIEFKREVGGRLIEFVEAAAGQQEVAVPSSVAHLIDKNKKVQVVIVPLDWLGEPEYEYATSSPFGR